MKFTTPNCPDCGEPAIGTVDATPGCALFTLDENGHAEYSGETKMYWDDQTTNTDDDGKIELQCHNGHSWFSADPELDAAVAEAADHAGGIKLIAAISDSGAALVPLVDAYDADRPAQQVRIGYGPHGIGVHFPGHGDTGSADESGEPVFIEYRDGVPHVVIWTDINSEDPTHVISLAGAALDKRK